MYIMYYVLVYYQYYCVPGSHERLAICHFAIYDMLYALPLILFLKKYISNVCRYSLYGI